MNFEIAPKSTEIRANWDNARLYCMFLEIDGKKGWRLPTKEELIEIYKSGNNFTDKRSYYWSSEEFSTDFAWMIGVYTGHRGRVIKKANHSVRAVRTIKE